MKPVTPHLLRGWNGITPGPSRQGSVKCSVESGQEWDSERERGLNPFQGWAVVQWSERVELAQLVQHSDIHLYHAGQPVPAVHYPVGNRLRYFPQGLEGAGHSLPVTQPDFRGTDATALSSAPSAWKSRYLSVVLPQLITRMTMEPRPDVKPAFCRTSRFLQPLRPSLWISPHQGAQ